ncbi:MAG: GGDEF domain-containing protein, partial [Geobacteraceae bacterium]|nr:GGDEF domain-containing protein [Geobacteraceae bacterium]
RSRFLEENIIGKHGYGYSMNTYKTIADVMEKSFFICEAITSIDNVSQRIQARKTALQYDDICVTRTGKYHGTVPISLLLNSIMERNINLAKGSNPLSGLPGNEFIQREISLKLNQSMHFDVGYIDIDNFKPYNDHYGFERGDYIIKSLAEIITSVLSRRSSSSFNFAGHIGGDDFIVVSRPQDSLQIAQEINSEFEAHLPVFHGQADFTNGSYSAKNRRGIEEEYNLLSLSIGIVSTEVCRIESYPQLASLATEVKKKAKMENGFSIVRDQRLLGPR